MTTKDYLKQIGRLNRMIENKLAEINQLKTIAYNSSATNSSTERVQTSADQDKIGNIVSEIVDTEKELQTMITKRCTIVSQIESVDNTYYYDILAKHYILGKDFKCISVEKERSMRHIGRMHDKALKEFEKMYGNQYLCHKMS